ncbi:MAG TPA: DUF952 domain-containing protein [Gracilimonas sp.]|uniref:hypothetical protein n=1 Tax=Gracilimonas sp. TaxID=1974203 RepID=UPI002D9616A2|nr:DUF952 domain-containing protein [Gracilimonas sp.]
MDIDLLFAAVKQSEWRQVSENGNLKPLVFNEDGYFRSFEGNNAEKILNHYFDGKDPILLIVLDPLRIQVPIKRINEDGFDLVAIQGEVSVDAIIDKIKIQPDKKGRYSINVKHFD